MTDKDPQLNPAELTPDQRQEELLRQGSALLVENLARLHDQGLDVVKDYMSDVLSDTEGAVPVEERTIIFTLLAGVEKANGDQKTIEHGKDMSAALAHNDELALAAESENEDTLLKSTINLLHFHEEKLEPVIKDPLDRVAIEDAHDNVTHSSRYFVEDLHNFGEFADNWSRAQLAEINNFTEIFGTNIKLEGKLLEAGEALSDGYKGEAVDLSEVISDQVKLVVAKKLIEIASQSSQNGSNGQEAILNLLQEDDSSLSKIALLKSFIAGYDELISRAKAQPKGHEEDAEALINRFRVNGQNEYINVNTVGAARDIFHSQCNYLEQAKLEVQQMIDAVRSGIIKSQVQVNNLQSILA